MLSLINVAIAATLVQAASGGPFEIRTNDLHYDKASNSVVVRLPYTVSCLGVCSGVVWISDTDVTGLPFELLAGDYVVVAPGELAFPVSHELFSGRTTAAQEARLSVTGTEPGKVSGLRLEVDGAIEAATNGGGLFAASGTAHWDETTRGYLVEDTDTGEVSVWVDDDVRTGELLVVGGEAHDVCADKSCAMKFDIGEDCWYKFDIGEDCWYKYDIGEDCWYRWDGSKWVLVNADPNEVWSTFDIGEDCWYKFDIGEDCWYKFDIGEDCWYKLHSGKWIEANVGATWTTTAYPIAREVRLDPISSGQLGAI